MKLGIMQPYLFPYIGYFSLIKATDKWIIFDTPQYIKKGWVNRNRVLKENNDWKYLSIPIKKASRSTPINMIEVNDSLNWKQDMINGLSYYKKIKAPNYNQIIGLVEESLAIKSESLLQVITHSLKVLCNHLDIAFSYQVFSEMNLDLPVINHPGEWALHISKKLGATKYINPPGGKEIFDPKAFEERGIELLFLKHHLPQYQQKNDSFIPGLSILDVLMFNSVSEIQKMLDEFTLEK